MKTNFSFILLGISALFLSSNPCFAQISSGGVFVLGGIHQSHETAKFYTYKRMGEIFQQLNPDILCVETQQKYVDDGSFKGTPFDFKNFMIPLALKDKTPIYGIDWWENTKGEKWQNLQQKAFNDSTYLSEINLIDGLFSLFDNYFKNSDFEAINSTYITNLWKAKNEFKYNFFSQHQEYQFITEFENERNNNIVENILKVINDNQNKKILVAIGIDHKYYIEEKLKALGITVFKVENIGEFRR